MKTHKVKCWTQLFERVKDGIKPFDVRKNDRDYQAGDILVLEEFDPKKSVEIKDLDMNKEAFDALSYEAKNELLEKKRYTGQKLTFQIGYVMPLAQVPGLSVTMKEAALRENIVILALLPIPASM